MVDVDSVGSGGGWLAWVDSVGAIRVGPESAGANPGPACYGRGGTQATLTSALVVLGFIDPERFLQGRMRLDAERAHVACAAVGRLVGLDTVETAWGIREVTLASMVRAVSKASPAPAWSHPSCRSWPTAGRGGLFASTSRMTSAPGTRYFPKSRRCSPRSGAATAA